MIAIARELDQKMKLLGAKAAGSLERLVRDALALIETQNGNAAATSAHRLPPNFFKKIANEFGPGPFERPPQEGN